MPAVVKIRRDADRWLCESAQVLITPSSRCVVSVHTTLLQHMLMLRSGVHRSKHSLRQRAAGRRSRQPGEKSERSGETSADQKRDCLRHHAPISISVAAAVNSGLSRALPAACGCVILMCGTGSSSCVLLPGFRQRQEICPVLP